MSDKIKIEIQLEFTPNPNTLKYVLNRQILLIGTENYTSKREADEFSPLASKLFGIKNVKGVMIGSNFISLTITSHDNLRDLNKEVMETIKGHLELGEPICIPRAEETIRGEDNETASRIREIINQEIRPAVAMDGGDITFERLEENVVYLHMVGACSGCPSSSMTLKMGIQNRIQQEFPEISDVVPL